MLFVRLVVPAIVVAGCADRAPSPAASNRPSGMVQSHAIATADGAAAAVDRATPALDGGVVVDAGVSSVAVGSDAGGSSGASPDYRVRISHPERIATVARDGACVPG